MAFRFLLGWYRSDKFRVDVIIFTTVQLIFLASQQYMDPIAGPITTNTYIESYVHPWSGRSVHNA